MVQPATTDTTEFAYAEIGHWRAQDEEHDWTLLHYMNSYLHLLDEVEQIYRDSGTDPGWSVIMDPATAPNDWLNWLGQFVGVTIPDDLTEQQRRDTITGVAGFKRGRLDTIIAAAQVHLIGNKIVEVTERYQGSAYRLRVKTYLPESPDPARTEATIRAAVPAGIVLTYVAQAGPEIDQLVGTIDAQTMDDIDDYAQEVP